MFWCSVTLKSEDKSFLSVPAGTIGQTQNPEESPCIPGDAVAAIPTNAAVAYSSASIDEDGQVPGYKIDIDQGNEQLDTAGRGDPPSVYEPVGSWFGLSVGKAFV